MFIFQIKRFEKLETDEERIKIGKEIYDQFIMKELLSQSHVSILFVINCLEIKKLNLVPTIVQDEKVIIYPPNTCINIK